MIALCNLGVFHWGHVRRLPIQEWLATMGYWAWVLCCWLGCPFSEIRVSPIVRERTRALHDALAFPSTAGTALHARMTCDPGRVESLRISVWDAASMPTGWQPLEVSFLSRHVRAHRGQSRYQLTSRHGSPMAKAKNTAQPRMVTAI